MCEGQNGECRSVLTLGPLTLAQVPDCAGVHSRLPARAPMKLRSHLFILAFGAIAPLAVLAVIAGAWLVEKGRETFRVGAAQRARALLTPIEAGLKGHLPSGE